MDIRFTVSPDFSPEKAAAWGAFGAWLGGRLERELVFEPYAGFASQREAVEEDRVDLIYATPFDAAMLVREKGFAPIVKPRDRADEALIAVGMDDPASSIFDLDRHAVVAGAGDAELTRIGLLLLQPADVGQQHEAILVFDSYPELAQALSRRAAGVGIFLKQAYYELPEMLRAGIRPLVTSEIHVVHHQLMCAPRLADDHDRLRGALEDMEREADGRAILGRLGMTGWDPVASEESDFTIDLMEALFA